MYSIEFKNVVKRFGNTEVIKGLDLSVYKGERLILLGASGCGKSTVLRMISGLETITSGELYLNGKLANSMDPGDRNIGMVFQNYALFPHMSVEKNISYGLKIHKIPEAERKERVAAAVKILNLEGLEKRLPRELSGGQRQRVALARAIVKQSDFFLLDEPLSNLDAQLRGRARKELVRLHEMYGQTMVYVTHDQIEAMTVGQRIAVIHEGRIQMLDTPHKVYHSPANIFVATFIGSPSMNIIDVAVSDGSVQLNGTSLRLGEGWLGRMHETSSDKFKLGIRPEDVVLSPDKGKNSIPVSVQYHEDYGSRVGYYFTVNGTDVISIMREDVLQGRAEAYWHVNERKLHFFDSETTESIGYPPEVEGRE
ncbi:MAG: ABC transporter ATP-binding protein [Dialister sp.]|nr:ABC transporter ATP-binding protein [Dialister sp.]